MGEGDVAVIVAAFNAEATIGRAVRSALAQKRVAEVVVVDDASRDDTAETARRADDGSRRLRIIALPHNAGPARARNTALDLVGAPYVCVLDADDHFLPDRIERLLRAGAAEPWDMLADDIVLVPEGLQHAKFSLLGPDGAVSGLTLDLATFVMSNMSHSRTLRGEPGFLKPIVSVAFLRQHRLRYDEALRLGEDYALYSRALIAGARFRVVGACGYVAIERADSISSLHAAEALATLTAFNARMAEHAGLSDKEREAFAAHHWSTLRKYRYRLMLDCKKERGFLPALWMLLSVPRFLPFIVFKTIQARLPHRAANGPRGARRIRLLLGLPNAHLSIEQTREGGKMAASAL